MKWAQFEENIGEVKRAREILDQLVTKYPMLLEARMQQIDLERREKNYEVRLFFCKVVYDLRITLSINSLI